METQAVCYRLKGQRFMKKLLKSIPLCIPSSVVGCFQWLTLQSGSSFYFRSFHVCLKDRPYKENEPEGR